MRKRGTKFFSIGVVINLQSVYFEWVCEAKAFLSLSKEKERVFGKHYERGTV